jgi:hypothetical protein
VNGAVLPGGSDRALNQVAGAIGSALSAFHGFLGRLKTEVSSSKQYCGGRSCTIKYVIIFPRYFLFFVILLSFYYE